MESFCTRLGISQEFSALITPQQNGIVERKNRVIQEMARAMLHNKDVARNLWGEATNTTCHTINRVYFRLGTKKTPYELWKGRKPNVKYFRIFGSTCFILKDRENVGKFDSQSNEGIFLGYCSTSKAYRVYNKRIMKLMETVNVVIDESSDSSFGKGIEEFPKEILSPEPKFKKLLNKNLHLQVLLVLLVLWKILQIYPLHQILNLMKRKDLPPGLN